MSVSERPVALLIHGYNVSNPELTVGRLRGPFEDLGYLVETLNYGYWPLPLQISRINPSVADRLHTRVTLWQSRGHAVDVVGHSNGCAIIRLAFERHGTSPRTVVAVNPALHDSTHPCPSAEAVQVWHNRGDGAVVSGKWLSRIAGLVPFFGSAITASRPWGDMGRDGYLGDSSTVRNFDSGELLNPPHYALGHSAVFHYPGGVFLKEIAGLCARQPFL